MLWLSVKWINCYDDCFEVDIYNVSRSRIKFKIDALNRIDQIINRANENRNKVERRFIENQNNERKKNFNRYSNDQHFEVVENHYARFLY